MKFRVSCELQHFPLNSEWSRLLSSGIRSLSALYSSPLVFSWSKATALVSLSQRIYSLVWHSQKSNFYTPALFPTAFSSLCAISCCTASVPWVYHWREIMSSPEKGRIFLSVTWCHLKCPECILHSSSQFRNVLVLCLQVCHTCQLHVAVWNILKHLKHCWIPTCDGFTRLWSSFEQKHHLTTDTLGESLQQELNPVWNVLSSTLWRGGELFPALAWILCEILGKSFKSWCFICQMGHYRALPARAGCGWADVTARTPGFFPEGIWGVISCAVSLKTWLLDGADGLCVTDGFLGQRIPVWASLTRCGQVMGSVWDTELQPQGISPTGDDLLLAGECLQRCDCAWWGYSTPKTQNRVGRMGVGFFWSDFSVYPSSSLW